MPNRRSRIQTGLLRTASPTVFPRAVPMTSSAYTLPSRSLKPCTARAPSNPELIRALALRSDRPLGASAVPRMMSVYRQAPLVSPPPSPVAAQQTNIESEYGAPRNVPVHASSARMSPAPCMFYYLPPPCAGHIAPYATAVRNTRSPLISYSLPQSCGRRLVSLFSSCLPKFLPLRTQHALPAPLHEHDRPRPLLPLYLPRRSPPFLFLLFYHPLFSAHLLSLPSPSPSTREL